jgi:uncharacterized membrane protein
VSATPAVESEPESLPGVERLLTLSDGVVAIALTLLVLGLKVPILADRSSAQDLGHRLAAEGNEVISYGISFYVIGQFWLAHHRVFRNVAGHSEGLAWWNLIFLLFITTMPFSSNLLGDYPSNPVAVDIFAGNVLLASVATQATVVFAHRRHLMAGPIDTAAERARQIRSGAVVVSVLLSIGLAWVNPNVAKYCWLLIAGAPLAATRYSSRKASHPLSPRADESTKRK